jgi:hypothetical protein
VIRCATGREKAAILMMDSAEQTISSFKRER